MKKFLLGAAAVLAISAPGVAAAQSAYLDLGYQSTDGDIAGTDVEGDGFTVGGATAWGGNGSLGVQLDGIVGSGDDVTNWNVGGHLFSRNANFLFGGFAGYGGTDVDGGDDGNFWSAGLEGQLYLSRTTLDGSIGFSSGDDLDADLTSYDLGVTQFFTDNFSLGANVGFGNVDIDGVGDSDVMSYGVGAEWQFASTPFSVFGGWQHSEVDDLDADADTLGVGVRYNWGGSLFERNRSGASLSRGGGLGRYAGLL